MRLAPYACRADTSRGRAWPEPESGLRSAYQRDRDRIVHSIPFRRLEYKTQVFVNFEGDHYRTRLTHSLEVAQIARALARVLRVDEDLAEAIALAHDLGHSAFGHAGEAALDEALAAFGGFDHNLQTFRIVTRLERRYAAFDGLNLTAETLEGLVKHNGPLTSPPPRPVAEHPLCRDLAFDQQPPLEAQIAAIADDVAYCNHDLDDGLRAGFMSLEELRDVPLVGAALAEVDRLHPGLDANRRTHETIRRLIDLMVRDLIGEAQRRLQALAPESPDAVRAHGRPVVAFSPVVADGLAALREFLRERVYRHYKVNRMSLKARRVVRELVEAFMAAPECLPNGWRERAGPPQSRATAETVRDYIAGMTDRYALDEHDRLFKLNRERP
ncbi:deoxyguanosinetriphosphate triphosphohydrolase [Benzoatithermus flavus]|uniref:Deoxyguanosinetriphosphate triphosphohydrolase-like protein n=1 Tax=Benzoatithermus flavus TaxID=3108223 RepID=A0ABU8XY50_9PROT